MPAIIRFLGYDPFQEPKNIPVRLLARRRAMDWSIKEAARQLGVDAENLFHAERCERGLGATIAGMIRVVQTNIYAQNGYYVAQGSTLIYLADASLLQLVLVCLVAFSAAVLSGLSGFGAGLVLPVFLSPLVGIANVIPVMAVVASLNNGSRVVAFWRNVEWIHVRHVLAFGMPACIAGAYGYTLLSSRWIGFLLGAFLLASIPLRRGLSRIKFRLSRTGERSAGAVFGFVNGGMTGTGVILISILMSAGVHGTALLATNAVVSTAMGIAKMALFSGAAILNLELAATGLLVGLCTVPGAFVARRLMNLIPARIHAWVMELVVIAGAVALLWHAAL